MKGKKDNCKTIREVIERNTGMSAEAFLKGKDSYFIKNLKEGKSLLYQAMKKNQFIYVMADYDVDGVSSGSIFEILFQAAKYTNYHIRFPKRFSEGYGIRESVINEIPAEALLITVDNGITAIEPIKKAKKKGITVMVVDHHQPISKEGQLHLPEADLIIDPHATGGCDFDFYCGAGLAYKLCSAFIEEGHPTAKKMLGFAALATIADVMPLIEENRKIVIEGLQCLVNVSSRTTGTYALLKSYDMHEFITESDVGYYIAPAINAMSRMNDNGAELAFQVLTFNGRLDTAEQMALNMHLTNDERKELVEVSMQAITDLVFAKKLDEQIPMCVYLPGLHLGIIGIIAGELVTRFKRPALVFTDSNGVIKGSGRTYGGVNLYNLLNACSDVFLGWGGHAEAAGMTLAPENLELLQKRLIEAFKDLGCEIQEEDDRYDLVVSTEDLPETIKELERYRPYGNGNPEIKLCVPDYSLQYTKFANGYSKLMGAKQQHIKFFGKKYNAIGFDLAKQYEDAGSPLDMSIVCTVSKIHYFSKRTCQLVVSEQLECLYFAPLFKENTKTQMANELADFANNVFTSRKEAKA